tara:strand:- start:501 stop:620 length:120 start_codon:yes stop_codon:yes gene_type:complete
LSAAIHSALCCGESGQSHQDVVDTFIEQSLCETDDEDEE